jgi:putative FmdB family regulatory protein
VRSENGAPPAGGASTIEAVPIYEFACERCETRFEDLVDAGTETVACPECGSERTVRVYSAPGAPPKLVKSPGEARRQERRNAQLRDRAKRRFKAARAKARGGGDG